MAVSPLFLFPYCGEGWIATTLFCLSLMSTVWIVMEPSRRSHEILFSARERVAASVLRDPLFWVLCLVSLLAAARCANGGVGMSYDAEIRKWLFKGPACSFLPGCVDGTGVLPFAGALATGVVVTAMRNALGRSARFSFLFTGVFLAGVAGVVAALMAHMEVPAAVEAAKATGVSGSYAGTAFALWFLCGLAALAGMFEVGWNKMLLLYSLGIGGAAVGALVFLPPQLCVLYALAGLLVLVCSVVYTGVKRGSADALKYMVAIIFAALVPVLIALALKPGMAAVSRIVSLFESGSVFAEKFLKSREILSSIAFKNWVDNPWLGTGVASFPVDMRFCATPDDWGFISAVEKLPRSGWWALLAERGIIGALMFAVPAGFLFYTFVRRFVAAFTHRPTFIPGCFLGVACVGALAAETFVDASFLTPETLMPAAAFCALAASSFPPPRKTRKDKGNDDAPGGANSEG